MSKKNTVPQDADTATVRVLCAYAVAALALPNVALAFTEGQPPLTAVSGVVLPVAAYLLLLTLGRRTGRVVWWTFPLVFLAAFQMVLLYLYGRSVIAVDMFLNLVTTNAGEAMELLDSLVPAVALVFIVYLPLLVWAAVSAWRRQTMAAGMCRRLRRWALGGCAAGLLLVIAARIADPQYRVRDEVYPVNVCYNLVQAVIRTQATAHHEASARDFSFHARATHPADSLETYVLVIGETARAPEFSLYGYGRDTSPRLCGEREAVAFTRVLSQSNTTHKSVPMLLSAVSAADYDSIYHERGLITAFREAGYHTVFLSNQRRNHAFIDFFGEEADECVFLKDGLKDDDGVSDGDLLPRLRTALQAGHRKTLIVLHTYGAHFDYSERYPRRAAHFLPDRPSAARADNRTALVNAYDNAIRYTDWLLGEIIDMLRAQGGVSAMLYTADHGENIFDDSRRLFLHASPVPSYYELHVPLVVWTSAAYRQDFPREVSALQANRTRDVESSVSVFHTMLHLAGIATPWRRDSLSLAGTAYRCQPRRYLSDHNEAVTLRRIGLAREDFARLRRLGFGGCWE